MEPDIEQKQEPEEEQPCKRGRWSVYLLITNDEKATYVGATVDPDRRLRQHNGIIKGGARCTTAVAAAGRTWKHVCVIGHFPDNHAALQFEWRWKSLSRRKDIMAIRGPLDRRLHALRILLDLDKPTSNAQLYSSYEQPLQINWSMPVAEEKFNQIPST